MNNFLTGWHWRLPASGASALLTALLFTISNGCAFASDPVPQDVDDSSIGTIEQAPDDWLSNGRTYGEQRYSPLKQINNQNISQIGAAWEADLESPRFGIEATPLAVGGLLFTTSSYGRVFAFDSKTGKRRWSFDPQVPPDWLPNGCCKPVNRGVALWKGKVFVGTYDGHLIGLDAATGKPLWDTNTTGGAKLYTITGAPLAANGKVIIGNAGADFATRGYLSAYDADTGKLSWRFYVVPGDPKKGFETPELAMAAKTWSKERDWSVGGDGNPWNALSYDAENDLLYVGTGNGPGEGELKNNIGGGDNLFTSSILAIHVSTGHLAWYYQPTPGDQWDFDATANLVLADIKFGELSRKVLMQANKNGFYYILDRITGQLLAADKFVHVNWADNVDLKTGRPNIRLRDVDWRLGTKLVFPGEYGAHNWMGMAFSPNTGLTYVPAQDIGWIEGATPGAYFYMGQDADKFKLADVSKRTQGVLIAWDPVHSKPKWSARLKTITNGGVLATAGNLVVQGTGDGFIRFYDATTGQMSKEILVGTGIVAPPMSYAVDGVQYIAIGAGWNGWNSELPKAGSPPPYDNAGRLIALRLGGGPVRVAARVPLPPYLDIKTAQSAELVGKGKSLYDASCGACHTVYGEGSVYPDLRRMSRGVYGSFSEIVLGGAMRSFGMASFSDTLTPADVDAIRAYITDWAQRSKSSHTQ
jgi:quinohemoprotein ethanol dehydrogenase